MLPRKTTPKRKCAVQTPCPQTTTLSPWVRQETGDGSWRWWKRAKGRRPEGLIAEQRFTSRCQNGSREPPLSEKGAGDVEAAAESSPCHRHQRAACRWRQK
ncbi:hypothetical protein BaRGS_00017192 [Batillaria attramentaria]|uniref:Uncharacterized protein n=1 Tax=Batillaria attramentaria TaxID=370345 RepID=A0ABD0KX85_9CAEN